MGRRQWVYAPHRAGRRPGEPEKRRITSACEKLIAEVLRPRFLPEIRVTEFNCPVDLYGKWHGHRYRFIERFRSGHKENRGEEFEEGIARLDWLGPDRFDLCWHRHTGEWFRLYRNIPLSEALHRIETESFFHPL